MAKIMGILFGSMNAIDELDVVIVNYNSGLALKKCIQKIMSSGSIIVNMVVVDNNSTDDSLTGIEFENKQINVIKNASNLGYAKACNMGAKQGQAKLIGFINPDCFISNEQLFNLSTQLINNDDAALVGCRVINENGKLQTASRRRLPTFWRIFNHMSRLSLLPFMKGINIIDDGHFDSTQTVEAVNGSCVMITRSDFHELNGFDEEFPLHFEDLDLFARIKKNNRRILYDPSVAVVHLKGYSKQQSKRIKTWKRLGLLRYLNKHRPKWEYKIARFFLGSK